MRDPFALLDAEEDLLGPEAREPRGNVSAILREFGRTPDILNGALLGRLNGTLDGRSYTGAVVLVRSKRFELQVREAGLVGTGEASVALLPAGVAIGDDAPASPPWLLVAVAWLVAAVVLMIRRRVPVRPGWLTLAWAVIFLGSVALFDLFVLQRLFGAGLLRSETLQLDLGSLLSQAAFLLVLYGAAFLGLAVPIRILLGRLVPTRWLPLAEAGWAVVWAVLPLLFAAPFFALGYFFARL